MISFEDVKKIYKDSSKESILRQFTYEHNLLRSYINAWEELKKSKCYSEYTGEISTFENMYEIFDMLETKHNIGREDLEVSNE